eukprot:2387393-Alexandrium_andersonii.AAC.1
MTTSQPSPSGAIDKEAVGRLSKKIDARCHSRRAVSSGTPSEAARAARSAGPLACSAEMAGWGCAALTTRWKAWGQAPSQRFRRVGAAG